MRLAHGLTSYTTFSNITSNRSIQQLLAIIYNNDINRVEAYVGSFAEDPAYPWYNLGPLLSTGIREQFTRIRNGDPFFFRNEGVLDALEAEMISHMSIGDLIMLNTKITNVSNNAFVKTLVKGNSSSSSINGNQSNYPTNSISFTPDFVMQWIISPDNTTISFNITSNYTGWFSIGFGETMNQMDMIMIVNEGGIWTPYDCHSTTPFIPSIDTAQNIINYTTVTGSGSGNITSKSLVPAMVSFSRLLNTGDPNDMIISPSDTSVPLSYAYYNIPNGKSYYHNPYQRGVVHVNLFSKAQVYNISLTDSGGGTSNNPASLWVHAIGMSIYFIVAYPIGIFYSRYYRNMGSWLTKHQTA